MHFNTLSALRTSALVFAGGLLLAGCGRETGTSERHLHGVVTLPPIPLWESEPTPRADDDEDNNDTLDTADGPFTINDGYHIIRGTADVPCDPVAIDDSGQATTDCPDTFLTSSDTDIFRIRANFRGPLVFKARMAGDLEGDVDITISTNEGTELYADGNATAQSVDDEGNPVTDDEGNPVYEVVPPRHVETVEGGEQFVVTVKVNAPDDVPADYELVIVGDDPNEHDYTVGIEGDVVSFSTGTDEIIFGEALDMKVGAYLNRDTEDLGDPVAGTTCDTWTLDEETETFWCAWDMAFAWAVTLESNVLVEGMGDGLDNDCDGKADTGTEDVDNDEDGVTIAQGDCNDNDANVHPFRGDEFGNRKDDDCDGWADNGPDDVDDDGDGYCENGVDANGDGVCRGRVETRGGLGAGDCNDADPRVNPGLQNTDIPANSLDEDCDGTDATLPLGTDLDQATIPSGGGVPEVSDLEEELCGTSIYDAADEPIDRDGDDLCDYDCAGEQGCPYDADADGHHDYLELLCGSDPDDADSTPVDETRDPDRDGYCDVIESTCGTDPALRFDDDDPDTPAARPSRSQLTAVGYCRSTCLGNPDCQQDQDQDGVHDGAEAVCGSDWSDPGSVPTDADDDGWCDREEQYAGTGDDDAASVPLDIDGDGLHDVENCIGEVGCPQDPDGDGFHSWIEVNCGSDPEVADMALPDFDGDGTCDGEDNDADNDGFQNAVQGSGEDCNDLDPNIHPSLTDDVTGEVLQIQYDFVNGIDDDCDELVDENYQLQDDGEGGAVESPAYVDQDEDGDGFTLALRDCDDTNADVRLGNYETRSSNVVVDDFSQVFLFAGDVASLNSTAESPNSRRTPEVLPYDLEKERVTWTLTADWENGQPPELVPSGLPVLEASYAKQPEVGRIWNEALDADGEEVFTGIGVSGFSVPGAPWPDGEFQELGDAAGKGKTNELYGAISEISPNTWDGDNDAYHVTFPEAGLVTFNLDWNSGGGDYDAVVYCYYFDAINPPNYYSILGGGGLATVAKPEEATTVVPLPDGADCWVVVMGYSGNTTSYTLSMTPAGND